jgi:predicted dehydrogenase
MVGVGVIGCGHWGPNHIRVFEELPESEIVAAVDADPAKLASINQRFPALRLERQYASLLADKRVEAVVVATPTRTHFGIVRDFLVAGKHILCEKPLCESISNARALVELAQERRLVLMTGHTFLFNQGVMALKEVICGGGLGRVRHLSALRTNLGPIRYDVNAAYDLAAHDIAIFDWLLDRKPIQVSACGAAYLQPSVEDVVSLSLVYPGNVFATIHASWLSPVKARTICVVGDRRMATWEDGQSGATVTIYDKGATVLPAETGDVRPRVAMWDGELCKLETPTFEPLKAQAQHFLRCLRYPYAEARSDGRFALDVVEALEAARYSMRAGGAPISLLGGNSIGNYLPGNRSVRRSGSAVSDHKKRN